LVLTLAINYKAYPTAYGPKALEIAKAADEVASKYLNDLEIIIIPPATEIRPITKSLEFTKVFAQHTDPFDEGAHTGYITIGMIKNAGATGVMINHSEHRLRIDEIEVILEKAKEAGLRTLVCANTPKVAASISILSPEAIAVEPPELIGTGVPVSKAKPEVITNSLTRIREVNSKVKVLTGAGITKGEDVEAAIKLGTEGVLVASAVMKHPNPKQKILELAEALHKSIIK